MEGKTDKSPRELKNPVSLKKGKKYKNLWTSLWSPSNPKRHARKDISGLSQPSQEQDETSCTDKVPKNYQEHQESNESIYSAIEDLKSTDNSEFSLKSEGLQNISSPVVCVLPSHKHTVEINTELQNVESTSTIPKEPVYATVNKDNSKILVAKLMEENKDLKQKAQEFVKEARRKEDTLYAKLQLEITQLEAETRKEVKSLSERIRILVKEKEVLNEQIDLLQAEKKEIQLKCDSLNEGIKTMIAPEFHQKMVTEYRKFLNEAKQKHEEERKEYQQKSEALKETNDSLMEQVKELKEKSTTYQKSLESLSSTHYKQLQEKIELSEQLEESKQMEQDNQKLLISLLKVTENLAQERDILLNKAFFQDNQQKELQTTVVDYSLNIGRLQEHILNMNKENIQELLKLQSNKYNQDINLQEMYNKQLDILREKVLYQNNSISELENEKRKLEMQLENVWDSPYDDAKKYLNMNIFPNV
ncbi:uncharacterized protein NPIL_551801 [Nephila pilipes]|uniref:Uncharacterized protein n=1 Tax=Nephila pilipes TaxID=299642 RepID=A0A8X6NS94_NEPPI|nr:uncharacterized protein NPIL_551801 [Nephila pilipes]